jgi:hypothetical protein
LIGKGQIGSGVLLALISVLRRTGYTALVCYVWTLNARKIIQKNYESSS